MHRGALRPAAAAAPGDGPWHRFPSPTEDAAGAGGKESGDCAGAVLGGGSSPGTLIFENLNFGYRR